MMPWRWGAAEDRMQLFMGGSNDTIVGQRYHRFFPFNFLLSLAAPHLHGVLVLVTGNVVFTGDKLVPITPSAAMSDFGGMRYHRFFRICRKNRPLLSIQFIASENLSAGAKGAVIELSPGAVVNYEL
jgi:hypothetical protein